ncbi:MAG: triple tyrosine motif-containing protein [Enterobacterales bacterium]|nr:triple tyrosine motif-containing protein [Enterobacterales bacterium]
MVNSDKKNQVYFERITRYNGLPNDGIYGILEDKNHKIWLSTNLGVVKYSENPNEIESYRSNDGLSSDEFNLGAYYSDENGRLYFGSINGITSINPKATVKKDVRKNIVFSKVIIGERSIDTYQLNHSDKPELFQRKDETAIDISVANISFSKINTQRYRYRILGLDGKWNYLETRRSIVIASLPQGNYTLEIQSRSSDQGWQGGIKRLYLRVETDFWNSRQGIYLIAFIIVMFYLISSFLLSRYHRKRLQLVENKSNLNELRLKEIKIDNELMLHELGEREKRLSSLHQKLDLAGKRLDSQRYKDITTGFYRVNYLYKVINEKILSQADSNDVDNKKDYFSLAIIELNDYTRIHQQHGLLIVTEFMSKLSELIKQKIDSGSQVFTVQNGELLILSKEKDNIKFKNKLLNLREQILGSYFDVANGISESTKVALSIFSLQNTEINSTRNLSLLIDLLLQAHLLNNDPVSGKVIEIVGAEQSVDFLFDLKSENISQYIQAGKVKYHILAP